MLSGPSKSWIITTNQYCNVMLYITREQGLLSLGTRYFCACVCVFVMCHVFYSQADDVCQVYVLRSFHAVLALAQMCEPAEQKRTKRKTTEKIYETSYSLCTH